MWRFRKGVNGSIGKALDGHKKGPAYIEENRATKGESGLWTEEDIGKSESIGRDNLD